MVVVILGVVAVIVLNASSPTPAPTGGTTQPGPTTTVPHTVGSGARLAAQTACRADFQEIMTAVGYFRALNSSAPPAGTAWATSPSNGGPLITSWPVAPHDFSLRWDGTTLSVLPLGGTPSHGSIGASSPATGCFAVKG